jgi:hypothetical protein
VTRGGYCQYQKRPDMTDPPDAAKPDVQPAAASNHGFR